MTISKNLNCSIVTVALPYHSEFLIQNATVLKKIDIDAWIIVGSDLWISEELNRIDKRFKVIPGSDYECKYGAIAAGVQHANSLKKGIELTTSNNVLILDPDFVILNIEQLEKLISDFSQSNKKIIGTPYFPIWYSKRMNAVGVYLAITSKDFLLNEVELYPKRLLEFFVGAESNDTGANRFIGALVDFFKQLKFANILFILSFRRLKINSDFDICADTENFYSNNSSEFLKIEITPQQLLKISPHLKYQAGRFFENLVPRKFSYLPNPYSILSSRTIYEEQVEHYSYKNVLLGGHFRIFGNQQTHKKEYYTKDIISNYLKSVLQIET